VKIIEIQPGILAFKTRYSVFNPSGINRTYHRSAWKRFIGKVNTWFIVGVLIDIFKIQSKCSKIFNLALVNLHWYLGKVNIVGEHIQFVDAKE